MPAAVVTGAGSGLGRAIAVELIGRGYRRARRPTSTPAPPTGPPRSSAPGAAARRSTSATRRPAAAAADVDRPQRLARPLGQQRRRPLHRPAWEQSDETARRTMLDVNAIGTDERHRRRARSRCARPAAATSSTSSRSPGIVAAPGEVAYSASKHAAMAFTLGTLFDLRRAGAQRDRALRRLPRRDLDADAGGQARRPRRRRLLLRPPAHRRAGGEGGRQADRAPPPDPDRPAALARPAAAPLRPLPAPGACDCCRW